MEVSYCPFGIKSLHALIEDTAISRWETYLKITELKAFLNKKLMIQSQLGMI